MILGNIVFSILALFVAYALNFSYSSVEESIERTMIFVAVAISLIDISRKRDFATFLSSSSSPFFMISKIVFLLFSPFHHL